jgi:hypothetical protein
MHAELFGRFTCPPIAEPQGEESDLQVSTVASLIYFESLSTHTGVPPVIGWSPQATSTVHEGILRAYRHSSPEERLGLDRWVQIPHLECRDALWLHYDNHLRTIQAFLTEFKPLIAEDVIRPRGTLNTDDMASVDRLLDEVGPIALRWGGNILEKCSVDEKSILLAAMTESDSSAYLVPSTVRILEHSDPELLDSTGPAAYYIVRLKMYLADLMIEALRAEERPSLVYRPVQHKVLSLLHDLCVIRKAVVAVDGLQPRADADSVAHQLTAEVLRKVPLIRPRTAAAVLDVRCSLAEELDDFRQAVRDIAKDLEHTMGGEIAQKELEFQADAKILRPLRNLERRLKHPGRDLAKNILSTGSFAAQAVSLGLATATGIGALGTPLLTVSSGLLASAVQTKFKRQDMIDASGLGFVIGAKQRGRRSLMHSAYDWARVTLARFQR